MTLCSTHARARAAWRCSGCQRALCPDCAYEHTTRGHMQGTAIICLHCRSLAQAILRKKILEPYWTMYPRFLRAMFSFGGLTSLLPLALALFASSLLWGVLGFIAGALFWGSYVFSVVKHTAEGHEALPDPTDFLGPMSLVRPLVSFFLASLPMWIVVFLIALRATEGVPLPVQFLNLVAIITFPELLVQYGLGGGSAHVPEGMWIVVALGVLYFPAAIATSAVVESPLAALNPILNLRVMTRVPSAYFLMLGVLLVLALAQVALLTGLTALMRETHAYVLAVPAALLKPLVPVFAGFVLGRFMYQHGEALGTLPDSRLWEPEWPDASPRARPS